MVAGRSYAASGAILSRAAMAKDLQIVGFRVGARPSACPSRLVHEIVRVPEITPVRTRRMYVEGVMNLRGQIIPVIDLRKRFGERRHEPSKKNRMLVVAKSEARWSV